MSLVVVQDGTQNLLDQLRSGWGTLVMGLFVINHVPAATDVIGDYTPIEASWTGYARQSVTGFVIPVIDGTGHSVTNAPSVVFSNSSGSAVTVYGYFMMDPTATTLLWAELDPASPVTVPDGSTYTVVPQLTMITE